MVHRAQPRKESVSCKKDSYPLTCPWNLLVETESLKGFLFLCTFSSLVFFPFVINRNYRINLKILLLKPSNLKYQTHNKPYYQTWAIVLPSKSQFFLIVNRSALNNIKSQANIMEQTQQKQRYLRVNILDKDYDAQQFMDFCQNYKGSIDIDSWTLDELKQIVQKFISSNSKTIQMSPFDYKKSESSKVGDIDWDKAFQAPMSPTKKEPPAQNFNLNLVDLDFLQCMGMAPAPAVAKVEKKPVGPPAKQPQIKKPNSNPHEILAKLNNQSNISAFNATTLYTQQKQRQPQRQTYQKEESSPRIVRKQPRSNPVVDNFDPTSKDNVVIDQHFKASIKCKSFNNKPKLDGNYDISVSGHQIINPNPFVPNYVLYTILTNPVGAEVKRRLKDFQTLRNLLKKIFPHVQIPHLERYGRRLSETDPITIKKQKLFLESFLNSLMMNKNIRCKIIDDFLLCQNLDTLKKIFRDFQKLDKPKSIQQLYTSTGRVQVQYNAQNKKFVNQQELYFDYLETNLIKLKELYDQLSASMTNSVKLANQIADLYDNLRDSTKNVNNLLNEGLRSAFLEETFDKISDLHKHWALSMKTQAKLIDVQVRHLCRFETANIDSIRQICKHSDSMVQTYTKRSDKTEAARQQYQFNKRLNDYKSGVDSPSKNTTVLRYQAGMYLQSTVDEIRRYLQQFSDKATRRFKIFSSLQLNVCNQLGHNWSQYKTFAQIHAK